MSLLGKAFLGAIGKTVMTVVEVPEIGRVGVRTSMLLGERSEYFAERKDNDHIANALLLKKTVCDPDSGELVLTGLTPEQINDLPTHVTDPLVVYALEAIGVKKEDLEKLSKPEVESEELKNSEADQS